jgi:uncharacterized protein YecE (DUF72 family)
MTLYLGAPLWGQKTWVGNFFPAGTKQRDFLAAYSRRLNTVEGNTTFYAMPDTATVERWRDETPVGFKFCFKVPQVISHRKRLKGCEAETAEFVARLRLLKDRCGPSFLQLPPTFSAKHLSDLERYLATWPGDLSVAVEPRHADFFGSAEGEFDALLRQHDAARCIFDTASLFSVSAEAAETKEAQERKPKFPTRFTRTARFAFVRFVCQPQVAANRPWLEQWAQRTAQWLDAGDDVFFFVHHPDDTLAPEGIRLFHSLVAAAARRAIPPLPEWGERDTQTAIPATRATRATQARLL